VALQIHGVMQNAQHLDLLVILVRSNAEQDDVAPLSTLAMHVKGQ
jgi:hypothetical protein